jgi:hypothetical protein
VNSTPSFVASWARGTEATPHQSQTCLARHLRHRRASPACRRRLACPPTEPSSRRLPPRPSSHPRASSPRRHARPPPALSPQPAVPARSSRGRGWWRAVILGPPPPVPVPLEVVADQAGEEADDGEVVADRMRSGQLGRGSGRRRGSGGSGEVGAARARLGDDARWQGARPVERKR